jgi:sensor histidine kinase YesM
VASTSLPFFLSGRRAKLFRHLLVWGVLWFVVTAPDYQEPYRPVIKTLIVVFLASFSYCNMYLLAPAFLFRKKHGQYLAGCLLLLGLSFWVQHVITLLLESYMLEGKVIGQTTRNDVAAYFVLFSLLIIASAGISLFQQWLNDTVRIGQLENAKLQIELKHLKSQVNPHFLINMLNNTDVLINREPQRASTVIHQLSNLLRYQLYYASQESVLLRDDITFLRNYLYLEQTRRDHLAIQFDLDDAHPEIFIQPMLFITFVENAVKHNTPWPGAFVHISFRFHPSSAQLQFTCINSYASAAPSPAIVGGIGIANIRRRLELQYAGRHQLSIQPTKAHFKVHLTIQL